MDWAEANRAFYDSGVWKTLYIEDRRICKFPTDLWVYEEVIGAAAPTLIVETGTYEGGSALWFARFAAVVTIDLHSPPIFDERVHPIGQSSTDQQAVFEVRELSLGAVVLVSLDSDHNADHVEREIDAYASLVGVGSYLVVEDTAVDVYGIEADRYPKGGPGVAVERFLARDDRFVRDEHCERFMLGMNPGGWLRRVK